jgi:sarcosine oxidase gamma subunit
MMLPSATVELVFPASLVARPAPWNAPAGAVLASESLGLALHFAPARWLLLETPQAAVAAAVQGGAVANDVGGKWCVFGLSGPHAEKALSAAVCLPLILDGRDCAALPLFDCPAVIARRDQGASYSVCVQSSYAASFSAALARANR